MSPKPKLSMLLCMPFYLVTSILGSHRPPATLGSKVTTLFIWTGIWGSLLMLPGNLFIRYVGANFGMMTLLLMNVYCHVESPKELFGEDFDGFHLLYDVVVSAGSVAAMLLAAFLPQYISHQYAGYTMINAEVGLFNVASVILVLNVIVTILCNDVLMSLPKATENYFAKFDLSQTHIVFGYYLAMVVFFFILLTDQEFVSTLRSLLNPF